VKNFGGGVGVRRPCVFFGLLAMTDENPTIVAILSTQTSTIAQLRQENEYLKGKRDELLNKVEEYADRLAQTNQKHDLLETTVVDLREENKELKKENIGLHQEIDELKNENKGLHQEIADLRAKCNELENEMEELRKMCCSISIREALRALENYLAVNILGSKSRVRKEGVFTLATLLESKYYTQVPKEFVEAAGLFAFWKDTGDYIVHTANNSVTSDELLKIFLEYAEDEEEQATAKFFVEKLNEYANSYGLPLGKSPLSAQMKQPKSDVVYML